MNIDQIITLINTVSKSSLSSFTLEEGNMKLSLEANRGVSFSQSPVQVTSSVSHQQEPAEESLEVGDIISSPLVGTFYAAASEDADPYVKVGDTINKGQVIGIVEAMKLMNHVESEYSGVVSEILVQNSEIVEYGQPLIRVIPE